MKRQIIFLILYVLAFLLSGLIHVFLYGVLFTDSIMLLIYGGIAFLWAIFLGRRIIDARIRRILIGMAALIELFFVLQLCNYRLFAQNIDARRFCWYAYYISMTMVPLLAFYLSLYLNRPEEKKLSKWWGLIDVFMFIIIALFLTNDLHFLVFRFLEYPMTTTAKKSYGFVYYVFVVAAISLLLAAVTIIIRKCRVTISRRLAWVPLVPLAIGIGLLVMNLFGCELRLLGIVFWNMGEIFFFMTLGFLECCIQIGLIPANIEYNHIFREMTIPVKLCDLEEQTVLITGGGEPLESESMRIEKTALHGGSVIWGVDVKAIISLDKQIEEATEQLRTRNEYLMSVNELKEEITALETRNKLYDRIAMLLKPQLDRIQQLLQEAERGDFTENLKRISVINAYIKRRSNLELLEAVQMPKEELALAVEESLNYLELCGIQTMLLVKGSSPLSLAGQTRQAEEKKLLPVELITLAYDFFEQVLENFLDVLKAVSVTISVQDKVFTLRMMCSFAWIHTEQVYEFSNWNSEALSGFGGHIEADEQGTDMRLVLTLPLIPASAVSAQKGGESV